MRKLVTTHHRQMKYCSKLQFISVLANRTCVYFLAWMRICVWIFIHWPCHHNGNATIYLFDVCYSNGIVFVAVPRVLLHIIVFFFIKRIAHIIDSKRRRKKPIHAHPHTHKHMRTHVNLFADTSKRFWLVSIRILGNIFAIGLSTIRFNSMGNVKCVPSTKLMHHPHFA